MHHPTVFLRHGENREIQTDSKFAWNYCRNTENDYRIEITADKGNGGSFGWNMIKNIKAIFDQTFYPLLKNGLRTAFNESTQH